MKFTQDQIIWIQDQLDKIEAHHDALYEFRRNLWKMKQEASHDSSSLDPSPHLDSSA